MGMGMEVVTGFVTAPGATFTAATMAAGNSLTVRNTRLEARIWLLNLWSDHQVAGTVRLRSPKLHDNVQGIRVDAAVSDAKLLLPNTMRQMLIPQDTLILEITGSAVAGDIETAAFLLFYEDLPGTEGRFIDYKTLIDRMVHLLPVENTLALGTAGGYSGEEAINAEFDLMKANTDYALLGYLVDTEAAVVRWRGADIGNLGLGGPGDELGRDFTASFFTDLARRYDMPLIPVFNSANKAGILIDGAQDENGADITVTSLFAELSHVPAGAPPLRR